MYNSLLDRVINVIERTVGREPEEQERSEFYNYLFAPDAYLEMQRRKRRKEELKNKLIVGATGLAVLGELVYIAKPALRRFKR